MNINQLPANMQTKITLALAPVVTPGLCWAWTGALNSRGYGTVSVGGRSQLSHRVSYELLVGPIKAGLQIDHLCTNKQCCNPEHLEPVTAKVNMARTDQANKTHCVHGHLYTPENTIWRTRGDHVRRQCRTCQYAYAKASA